MTVDDGRKRKSTFAGLLLVLSALAAAFARRRPWEDGPRLDPGVIAGRRNLRVPLLELTSDPRSVAPREPSPAVMRVYVSVSSIERMRGAAETWAQLLSGAASPPGGEGVAFLLDGDWTASVDFGSLRQAYPHVEVLDARRADVGQEDSLPGHGTTRAMFALQRGRPEDFACLLDDDLVVNVPILQRELQDKCQSEHCIMGEILGQDGEQRTAGGWCMNRALVDSIGELLATMNDHDLPWPAEDGANAQDGSFHDMLRQSHPDLWGQISYVPSMLWYTENSLPVIERGSKVSKRTQASYRGNVWEEMQANFLHKVSREFLSVVAAGSAVYPAGWDDAAVSPPRRESCPRPILEAIGIYSDNHGPTKLGLEDTLLLVSSNAGQGDFLDNWRHYADRLKLKYGIVAMDNELYSLLGVDRTVLAGNVMTTSASRFRTPDFNAISCNKLSIVLDIMESCDVSVVFSDVDNVFIRDPFQHDLGDLIKMNSYNYIYTRDGPGDGEKDVMAGHFGSPNTGFHYVSRDSAVMRDVLKSTVDRCSAPDNMIERLDDQALFWQEMKARFDMGRVSPRHCKANDGYNEPPSFPRLNEGDPPPLNLCCLDPVYYRNGATSTDFMSEEALQEIIDKKMVVTYHANYAGNKGRKQEKLERFGLAQGFNVNKNASSEQKQ